MRFIKELIFGRPKVGQDLQVKNVFSTSVIAPASYLDRSARSTDRSTRGKIRRLKTALQQPGLVVGIYGDAKSGKTMFTRKTLLDGGYGFVVAESTEMDSVESFWRHLAQKLQLNIRRHITVNEQRTSSEAFNVWLSSGFSVPAAKIQSGLKATSEVRTLEGMRVDADVLESVREACLNFLEAARMAVIIDDFHNIADDAVRRQIVSNVKAPAGLNRGKYVFVSVPQEALFVGRNDEQLIGRANLYEFPDWNAGDLREIARQGFEVLGIGFDDKQIVYIERNSFNNPINVQQICINICAACGIESSRQVPPGFVIPADRVELALQDFAHGLNFFDDIVAQAETLGGAAAAEKKYRVGGVQLNVYQLVFAGLCYHGAVTPNGVLQKTIRDRVRRLLGDDTWSIPNLDQILQRLAESEIDIQYARRGPDPNAGLRPLLFDAEKKKLYVTNPMLRVYLLWGYLPGLGLDIDDILGE